MKYFPAALLLFAGSALGACNSSPAVDGQLITGDHPAQADTLTSVDTTATKGQGAVPFVTPTKIGRVLGPQSPSPPASRTR